MRKNTNESFGRDREKTSWQSYQKQYFLNMSDTVAKSHNMLKKKWRNAV
jgi:hypothetical protein